MLLFWHSELRRWRSSLENHLLSGWFRKGFSVQALPFKRGGNPVRARFDEAMDGLVLYGHRRAHKHASFPRNLYCEALSPRAADGIVALQHGILPGPDRPLLFYIKFGITQAEEDAFRVGERRMRMADRRSRRIRCAYDEQRPSGYCPDGPVC